MSTKLYDGLRMNDDGADLLQAVPVIAAAVKAVFLEARKAVVAECFAAAVDGPRGDGPSGLVFFDAQDAWTKRQAELGATHALNDPLRFSMVFGRAVTGRVLAYPYHRLAAYDEALASTGLLSPHPYWNNTDRPDDLTDDEWDARRREWDSIMVDDCFSHLPMWQLGGSMSDVFGFDLLTQEGDAGLDALVTRRSRFALRAEAAASAAIPSADLSDYLAVRSAVRRAIDVSGPPEEALPPALPPLRATYDDVDKSWMPRADAVIEGLVEAVREELGR